MRIVVHNFNLLKADIAAPNDLLIPVKMIANTLRNDRENHRIAKEAFSDSTVAYFLKHGLIDWQHQSKTGETDDIRQAAILGRPAKFAWDGSKPMVYGNLTKANPMVAKNLLPHLEAGNDVFNCSVGGSILKAKTIIEPAGALELITHIYWDHIAIAGKPYVMAPGSDVMLNKAEVPNKADEISYFDYDSMLGDFLSGDKSVLAKALIAGGNTTSVADSGFSVAQPQSLEGAVEVSKQQAITEMAEKVLELQVRGIVGDTWQDVRDYLSRAEVPKSQWDEICNVVDKFLNSLQGGQ